MTSDEYRENHRRAEEEQWRQMAAINTELKRRFAVSIGKTVETLTRKDMEQLNKSLFQGWLKYHGVTEQQFWGWIGG